MLNKSNYISHKLSAISFIALLFLILPVVVFAQDGRISGKVVDANNGDPLPGANVIIENTSKGASTDLNGEFTINRVSAGTVSLTISYIGYQVKEQEVTVRESQTTNLEIELSPASVEGEEVVISAQAQGQREAINQQTSAINTKSVVSSAKIQELPEANAAEAVGRLPGVTLKREGGEGNKVVIRGLSPKYNKIQVEGVSLSSTDEGNRSTDLSMISSYMLGGIEVTKSALANQEADQIGGTVNFKVREAAEKPMLKVVSQGGYNELRNTASDYKFVVSGSKRFLDDKLGVFANIDVDRANRSSNSVNADYTLQPDVAFGDGDTSDVAVPFSQNYQDVRRIKNRYGGSIVLDYNLPNTNIQYFTMYNQASTHKTTLQEGMNVNARSHQYNLIDQTEDMSVITHSVKVEQTLGDINISGGVSYNSTERIVPDGVQLDAGEPNAFSSGYTFSTPQPLNDLRGLEVRDGNGFLHPSELINKANLDTANTGVDWIYDYDSEVSEDQYGANISAEYEFELSDNLLLNLEVGGKHKHLEREYDYNSYEHPMTWTDNDQVRIAWANKMQENGLVPGYNPTAIAFFPYRPFIDQGYDGESFLDGQFELNRVPDADMVREYIEILDRVTPEEGYTQGLAQNYNVSVPDDYSGNEDYYAAYLMPTLKVGQDFTLIPGLRYEQNRTSYTGVRAFSIGRTVDPFPFEHETHDRKNEYFLPMIHARYNVNDWFDIRTSYTQSLSRPDYNRIIPSWIYTPESTLQWNNPDLEPIEATNYDLTFSWYSNKIGLLTIGGFYKDIANFIYQQDSYIIEEEQLSDAYPENMKTPATIIGYINNPNDATLYGAEIEWQSNFWYLPGAWSGIVLGVNYSYTYSQLTYPKVNAVYERVGFARKIAGSEDASYTTRLIDQPDHVLNLTLGFDYKGFSIRGSMRYKSDIFRQAHFFPELRQNTRPITLYDLSMSQKLPLEGLNLFFNAVNINGAIDVNTINSTDWYANKEFYGLSAQLGLRYTLEGSESK